jgi:hypothetical protein
MILSIVAVGEYYIRTCKPHLEKFKNNGYNIKILTDAPKEFEDYETFIYENKIFSYFDKLLFSFRLIEKFKEDVLYIDADWIENVDDNFLKKFKGGSDVLYYGTWEFEYFKNYVNDVYWKDLLFYFNLNKIKHDHLLIPLEWMFYFPNTEVSSNIIYDLEKIKPIFDWISTVIPSQYSGNGNGEGLGLSYVLDKNQLNLSKFDINLFKKPVYPNKLI